MLKTKTVSQVEYTKHHKSSAYALIRAQARALYKQHQLPRKCFHCGYDKHIEICHIKPIKDFDKSTPISEVNKITNIIGLCPNCHWEFDNNLIQIEYKLDDSIVNFKYTKKSQPKPEKRKVIRPDYQTLISEVKKLGFSAVGRKYNVSDNAIRKWIKIYKKYQ